MPLSAGIDCTLEPLTKAFLIYDIMQKFNFWKLLVGVGIFLLWLCLIDICFEYLVNKENNTLLFGLCILVTLGITFLTFKILKSCFSQFISLFR